MLVHQLHTLVLFEKVPSQAACIDSGGGASNEPDAHAGLKDGLLLTGCLSGRLDVQLSCQALTSVQHRAGPVHTWVVRTEHAA